MGTDNVEERIGKLVQDVFDRPDLAYRPDLSAADVDEWDSLSHVSLLSAIEKEFGVRFTLFEVAPLKNLGEMVELVRRKAGLSGG